MNSAAQGLSFPLGIFCNDIDAMLLSSPSKTDKSHEAQVH